MRLSSLSVGGKHDDIFHPPPGDLHTRLVREPAITGGVSGGACGSLYTSIAFTDRLTEAGIDPSVGSVGDYDNAPAETVITQLSGRHPRRSHRRGTEGSGAHRGTDDDNLTNRGPR